MLQSWFHSCSRRICKYKCLWCSPAHIHTIPWWTDCINKASAWKCFSHAGLISRLLRGPNILIAARHTAHLLRKFLAMLFRPSVETPVAVLKSLRCLVVQKLPTAASRCFPAAVSRTSRRCFQMLANRCFQKLPVTAKRSPTLRPKTTRRCFQKLHPRCFRHSLPLPPETALLLPETLGVSICRLARPSKEGQCF